MITRLLVLAALVATCALHPQTATAQTTVRLPIEKVMRDAQARYVYLANGGAQLTWPGCCGTSGSAPAYPPDGFYGEISEACAASLVSSLQSAVGSIAPSFLDPAYANIEGQSFDPEGSAYQIDLTEFGWVGGVPPAVTTTNYAARLAACDAAIQKCRYEAHSGIVGGAQGDDSLTTMAVVGTGTCDMAASYIDCDPALNAAISSASSYWTNCGAGGWAPCSSCKVGIRERACTFALNPGWTARVELSKSMGRVFSDLSDRPGGTPARIYIKVQRLGNAQSNNPPVEDDMLWHFHTSASAGAMFTGQELVGNGPPNVTFTCGTAVTCGAQMQIPSNGERGWTLEFATVILEPNFNPSPSSGDVCLYTSTLPPDLGDSSGETEDDGIEEETDCNDDELDGGDDGATPGARNPVDLASGHKAENAVDLVIPLTGPDLQIVRRYSSQHDLYSGTTAYGLVGANWTLSVFQRLDVGSGTSPVVNVIGASHRRHRAFRETSTGSNVWSSGGPTTQSMTKPVLTVNGVDVDVWRLKEPGRWERDFYRAGGTNSANTPHGLEGRLLMERDTYGNSRRYHYAIYPTGGSAPNDVTPRLYSIDCKAANPTGSVNPEATVRFYWDTTSASDALRGKLKSILVHRYAPTQTLTNRVDYTYKAGSDDFLGTEGDLVQVKTSEIVDKAPSPTEPLWVTITQYRYHNGTTPSSGDERIAVSGTDHQLKSIFDPEQMEFLAQESGATTVADAAATLLTKGDGDAPYTGSSRTMVDYASKIVSYETSGTRRVAKQYLQTACGCGGGSTQGLREEYAYFTYTGGQSTQITQKQKGTSTWDNYRIVSYDMVPKGDQAVPYLATKVIEEPGSGTRKWAWHYEYDTDRRLIRKMMPSALTAYTRASTGTAPSYSASASSGLVHGFEYTSASRLTKVLVGNGTGQSPFTLVEETTYPASPGTNERLYLPTKIERFRVAGSTSANDVETTTLAYGFHPGSQADAISFIKTSLEAELESENGPAGSALTYDSYELFDVRGRNYWSRDAANVLTYCEFQTGTGALATVMRNAGPAGLPSSVGGTSTSGWGRLSDGGSLTTTYVRDLIGRTTQTTSPGGVANYVIRELRANDLQTGILYYAEVSLPHRITGTPNTFDVPATVTWYNAGGQVSRSSDYDVQDTTYTPYAPNFAYTLGSSDVARSTRTYHLSGLLQERKDWHAIGRSGTPFYTTAYAYDALGRVSSVVAPNGAVTVNSLYDILGRVLEVRVGTSTSNAVNVAEYFYDHTMSGPTPVQGVGDGNLTFIREWTGEASALLSAEKRDTKRVFDWRNRMEKVIWPLAPHEFIVRDNLNRVTKRGLFSSDPGGIGGATDSNRGLYTEMLYSQRGLLYKQKIAIDAASLAGGYLESNFWFDEDGRALADWRPNAPATKRTLDAHGRTKAVYTTDRGGDAMPGAGSNHTDAIALSSDVVLEQNEFTYDTDSTRWAGRLVLTKTTVRNHDSAATGALDSSSGVATYLGYYYDGADRQIRAVNFGTNTDVFQSGGTITDWPPSSAPGSSYGTALVSMTEYNQRGLVDFKTDPEGRKSRFYYDDLSRQYSIVENYDSANPPTISWTGDRWSVTAGLDANKPDTNRVTSFVLDGAGNTTKQVAHVPTGTSEKVQVTLYTYGTEAGSHTLDDTSLIESADLLKEVAYPQESGGSAGEPGTTNDFKVRYSYNSLGELRAITDQNGTKHVYARDDVGRALSDTATLAVGSPIDNRIKRISANYDSFSRVTTVKSYDSITGTPTVANAVEFIYSPLWQVTDVFQDHNSDITRSGSTPTGDTRVVRYAYANQAPTSGTGGSNFGRLSSLTYPDGTVYGYGYGSSGSADDRISRVVSGAIGSDAFLSYSRVGLDLFTQVDLEMADVQLDRTFSQDGKRRTQGHTSQDAGVYPGFDRHGRVAIQAWLDGDTHASGSGYPTRPPIVDEGYAYDKNSNRTQKYDLRPGVKWANPDVQYSYDGLDRLKEAKRGLWTVSPFATLAGSQQWALDMLGNWVTVKKELTGNSPAYGDAGETEDRTHNEANEVTNRYPNGTGTSPTLPFAYDAAGNLSSAGRNLTTTDLYAHDAWNRLVKHKIQASGFQNPLPNADYEYNGLHWRTVSRRHEISAQISQERLMYYSAGWQLLEERIDEDYENDPNPNRIAQEFWGIRYIDDAVLRRVYDPNVDTPPLLYYHLTDAQFSTVAMIGTGADPLLVERVRYEAYGKATHRWPSDFNDSGSVNATDNGLFTNSSHNGAIGTSTYDVALDLNRDGAIDSSDVALYSGNKVGLASGLISDVGGPDNVFGFDGYVFSAEAGLYCVRFRWYDPLAGRWLEWDPLSYVDGMNNYESFLSSPVVYIDVFGLDGGDEWMLHRDDHGGPHFQRGTCRYRVSDLTPIGHGGTVPAALSEADKMEIIQKFGKKILKEHADSIIAMELKKALEEEALKLTKGAKCLSDKEAKALAERVVQELQRRAAAAAAEAAKTAQKLALLKAAGKGAGNIAKKALPPILILLFVEDCRANGPVHAAVDAVIPVDVLIEIQKNVADRLSEWVDDGQFNVLYERALKSGFSEEEAKKLAEEYSRKCKCDDRSTGSEKR